MNNVNYENPVDLIRRQMQRQSEAILAQAIATQGVLVDVFKSSTKRTEDTVYGGYSGQKLETLPSYRIRVLGLEFGMFRASKSNKVSGWFQGGFAFALCDPGIEADDVLVEVGTEIKFIVVGPEVVGTAGPRKVVRFQVSSMFE